MYSSLYAFRLWNISHSNFFVNTKDNSLLDIRDLNAPKGQIITFVALESIKDIKIISIIDDINETIKSDEKRIRFYNLDSSTIMFSMNSPDNSISESLAFC